MISSNNTKTLNDDELTTLRDGTTELKLFYDWVMDQMKEKICSLQPGQKYILKKIFGRELWSLLENGERKLAGKCVALMVAQGELALESLGTNSANHQQYQLK